MSDINGINIKPFTHQGLKDEKTGQVHDSPNKDTAKKTGESTASQVNRLIIEMHLKIKIDSKEHIGNQAGIKKHSEAAGIDLSKLMYNGKPITDLSQDEAKALISEDGFFGVKNTAQRIFDFALKMAGDDPERLQTARDAVLRGFKEAENIFGGTLPDISYDTINKVLEMMDEKIRGLGGSVLDVRA
ncbi:MAG: hydrogenase-4 component G [Nitrospiraceae bacterium]|nr:MAG: hydrogenase-4 component G [Nitrospiraceae bacterium]